MRHFLCNKDDVQRGTRTVIEVKRRSLVLVCTPDGKYHAIRNICPHEGAQLALGQFGGTLVPSEVGVYEYGREGEIVRCPWHGYEFDVTNGCSLHDESTRVSHYEVLEENNKLYLDLEDS